MSASMELQAIDRSDRGRRQLQAALSLCTQLVSAEERNPYAADLADFRIWLAADVHLTDITTEILKDYLSQMVGSRKLAIATIRRRLACLRGFFRRAAELGQILDPFLSWRLKLPRRKRLPRALSRGEVSSLLNVSRNINVPKQVRDQSLMIAIRLMISTGMRVGELCKLHLEDLSPDASSVRIHGKVRVIGWLT
jgi:integrase/recombinase XerD